MNDTLITASRKRFELYLLLACMIAAYVLNIVGILKYKAPAIELVTQVPLVLLIGVIFYVCIAVIRLIIHLFSLIIKRR